MNTFSSLLTGLPPRQGFGDATLIRLLPGSIDLGGGNPDVSLLPIEIYRKAFEAVVGDDSFSSLLRYSPAPGLPGLRAAIAARKGVDIDRVLVTNGGAHGLALAALATLNPGDTIVVDDPVYPLFLRVLDLIPGVRVAPIRVTADGIDVSALEEALRSGLRPTAVFTVPTFQNPTGVTLSDEKAHALTQLADHYDFTIIADDPYREISFPSVTPPTHRALRDSDRVLGVNSFSKTLGPGLRLGWLVVPAGTSERLTRLRNRLDGQSSGVLQAVVERMLLDPTLDQAVAAAGEGYERKSRVLTDALHDGFGERVEVTSPAGGFFVWAQLAGDLDFGRLFDEAQTLGVSYQRGEWFAAGGADHRGRVRLSFSEPDEEGLYEGVSRLANAYRALF